jgi:glycosyltransferase involved in cell wall biosynthesis
VIVFVGTLAQLYKAPDVLLRAVAICLSAGADVTLRIVGDGRHRRELEALAEQLGIAARTVFVGELATRAAVVAELDRADLFVLPSHQEGLPRALIEAMARGLPCLGSTVGGIPELLDGEDVIEPGNVEELAALMLKVLRDRTRREAMALRNQSRARLYQLTALRPRRAEFYRRVQRLTADWLATPIPRRSQLRQDPRHPA